MPHLLHLDSSADGDQSRSRAITATFARAWTDLGPTHTIAYRDLHAERLPHLADAAQHWPERLRKPGAVVPEEAQHRQDEILAQLLAADVLLVGAPLYNYSVPSTLKAWIDHVHVPGLTAPFDVDSQPMKGRPCVVVTSRGGAYDEGTETAGFDHAVPVLELILGRSLGMEVEVITASLTLAEDVSLLEAMIPRSRDELAAAHAAAEAAARRLG